MRIRLLAFLAVLFLLPFVATAAMAAEARIALVIGNGAYKDAPLKNPPNDAKLMAKTLRGLGFEVIERIDADQKTMRRAILDFGAKLEKAGGEAVGLAFYAGHGVQANGRNFLIPVGAQIDSEAAAKIEGVETSELLEAMEQARARLNFVILDACRNNPFARSFRSASRGLARMDAPRGTMVAYATRPGDVANDGNGSNSPYTSALVAAMQRPGLAVSDMFIEVRNKVMTDTGDKQVPWEEGGLTSQFYFAGKGTGAQMATLPTQMPAPAPAPAPDKETVLWQSIQNTANSGELRAFLNQYPNGAYSGVARARLEVLEARANVAGTWRGFYHYPSGSSNPPVAFQMDLQGPNESFMGRSAEPNTFGDRSASQLFANIRGVLDSNGNLRFVKTYDGTGNVNHSVDYSGRFDPQKGAITGNWRINDFSGRFEMTRQ